MPKRTNRMPKNLITELTPEQEELLLSYREKWRSFSISTEPLEYEKASQIIVSAYDEINYPKPEILFHKNPLIAIQNILKIDNYEIILGKNLNIKLRKRIHDHLNHIVERQLDEALLIPLRNRIRVPMFPYYSTEHEPRKSFFPSFFHMQRCTEFQLIQELEKLGFKNVTYSKLVFTLTRFASGSINACFLDFCISALSVSYDKKKWSIIQDLIRNTDFIFLFENVCVVCDRLSKISLDDNNFPHAEREAALQFPDSYGIYANHGKHPYELELERLNSD